MHSIPKSKNPKEDSSEARIEKLQRFDSSLLEMPEVGDAKAIVDIWIGCGLCDYGFSVAVPLSWQTIHAFNALTDASIDKDEAYLVMEMSKSYCSWLQKGSKPDCQPPFVSELAALKIEQSNAQRVELASKIKNRR